MPVLIKSGDPVFDALPDAVREWLDAATMAVALGGETVRAVRAGTSPTIALREHTLALEAAVFFDSDVVSALDVFLRAPLPDGSLFGSFRPIQDCFTSGHFHFIDRVRSLCFERDAVDAQIESLAVLAAYRVWQANSNKSWLQSRLPVLERALENLFIHPYRWSHDMEMPKRAFTLDAWPLEFQEKARADENTGFGDSTKWCVHPGDAALLFQACNALAALCEAANAGDAARWRERASHIEAQTNSIGWNGSFYTHQVHLIPARVRGVDETRQLAACNVAAMNSGLAGQEQCVSVLKEYQRRRELNLETSFCEWWNIQPAFPDGAFPVAAGKGANGGIWPRIGGDLAHAALWHGFETYGVETLRRFHDLALKNKRVFPAYLADGSPLREDDRSLPFGASSHDAAGAAAMLRALIEGICGVRDEGSAFGKITLAPRWPATGMAAAEVEISYAANPAYVNYRWALDGGRMTLDYESRAKHVDLHILLPRGNTPERVALNGRTHAYQLVTIEKSKYVALSTDRKRGTLAITLK